MFPAKVGVPVESRSGPGFPGIPARRGVSARNREFLPGMGFPDPPGKGFPDPPGKGFPDPPRKGVSGPPPERGVPALLIKGRLTCKTAKLDSASLHVSGEKCTFSRFRTPPGKRGFPDPVSGRNPEFLPGGQFSRFQASFWPRPGIREIPVRTGNLARSATFPLFPEISTFPGIWQFFPDLALFPETATFFRNWQLFHFFRKFPLFPESGNFFPIWHFFRKLPLFSETGNFSTFSGNFHFSWNLAIFSRNVKFFGPDRNFLDLAIFSTSGNFFRS